MPFTDMFLFDRGPSRAAEVSITATPAAIGVFTSWQSLVAFPLATCVVATAARAGRTIGRTDFDSIAMPLTAALVVGAAIFVLTVMDTRARPQTLGGWLASFAVAFVNSLLLFVAALGIEKF
jgi:hypothetical protein